MGVQAAQIAHAAGESFGNTEAKPHVVVLTTPNQSQLKDLEYRLRINGVVHQAIKEPDPPWDGELMAIGIAPVKKSKVQRFLSHLPLLRGEDDVPVLELDFMLILNAVDELDRLRLWEAQDNEYDREQNVWKYKHKKTVLCTLIAHHRNTIHLQGFTLVEQQKYLYRNRMEWEHLRKRQEKPVMVLPRDSECKHPKRRFFQRVQQWLCG